MGSYDSIGVPVKGQRVSSGAYGIKVRDAIIDLDRRVSAYDTSTGTGLASSTSSLVLSTTTETAALTITGMVFKAGLAYEATMRMGLASGTSGNLCQCRLRKYNATPSSGADWGEYFRFEGKASNVMSCIASIYLLNATAADITSDVNLVVQSSVAAASAITCYANANSPRFLIIKPAGFAANYTGMGVQVS